MAALAAAGSVNHIPKQYAFSPTGKNPAENMPFVEINVSAEFSTERDDPGLRLLDAEDANGEDCARKRRTMHKNVEAMYAIVIESA